MMKKSGEKIKTRRKTRRRKRFPRLGREETERRIIELYNKEGATFPEIAAECHSSATTIKKVIDRYEKLQVPPSESKHSAALLCGY